MGLSPSIATIVDEEQHFLNAIINVLHLFISRNEIGLDYVAIVNHGIECTDNKINEGRYGVSFKYCRVCQCRQLMAASCVPANVPLKKEHSFNPIASLKLPAQ